LRPKRRSKNKKGAFCPDPFRVPSLEALSGFSFAERETSLTHGGSLRSLQAKKRHKKGALKRKKALLLSPKRK
jgi:hypothetical protein